MTLWPIDYYGGGQVFTPAASEVVQLWLRGCRMVLVRATGAGAAVRLVDALGAPLGAEHHHIANDASVEALDIQDHTGAVIETVPAQQISRVWLQDNTTEAGVWAITPPVAFTTGAQFA